jgi:hypothetical protein
VAQLDQLRTGGVPDMDVIGRLLAEPTDTTASR